MSDHPLTERLSTYQHFCNFPKPTFPHFCFFAIGFFTFCPFALPTFFAFCPMRYRPSSHFALYKIHFTHFLSVFSHSYLFLECECFFRIFWVFWRAKRCFCGCFDNNYLHFSLYLRKTKNRREHALRFFLRNISIIYA